MKENVKEEMFCIEENKPFLTIICWKRRQKIYINGKHKSQTYPKHIPNIGVNNKIIETIQFEYLWTSKTTLINLGKLYLQFDFQKWS